MPEYTRQRQQPDYGDDLLAARIARAKGPVTEKRLPDDVRSDFEARSGYSARNLRVVESDLPNAADAYAVTQGSTIHFPRGGFAPGTGEGRQTLMHELAHTVQQAQGKVRANRAGVVNDSPALEQAADTAFAGPVPSGESSVASASLAAMPTPSAGAPMQLSPHVSPIKRLKNFVRRARATGQEPANRQAQANAAPAITVGTAFSQPASPTTTTGGNQSGGQSGGQSGNQSGGPANTSAGNTPAPASSGGAGSASPANASGNTATARRVFDQDVLDAIDPNFTEEQLEQGMGRRELASRQKEVAHEESKAEKRKFYDEVRKQDQGFPYNTSKMEQLMISIRAHNPYAPGWNEREREDMHRLRAQHLEELNKFRQEEEVRHLNWLYGKMGADSSMPWRARMAKRERIDKAVRHNQKKDLKAFLADTPLVQYLMGYNGRTYDPAQHTFSGSGPTPAAAAAAANVAAAASSAGAAGGSAPPPAAMTITRAEAATKAGWVAAQPRAAASTRAIGRSPGPNPLGQRSVEETRREKVMGGVDKTQEKFGLADPFVSAAIGSDQEVKDLREAFTGRGTTAYEGFVNGTWGTLMNHSLSAVGLANDAFSAGRGIHQANRARQMGDKMTAAEKGLEAAGNMVSAGGRVNSFFSGSPDPVGSAFGLVGNVIGTAASSVGVQSARQIRSAMEQQMASRPVGMNTSDQAQVQAYRMRREAELAAKRKHVSSGFGVANNVIGAVGNAAGFAVGPGTIIKIASMGLTGLGALAQMITDKALDVHHRHLLLDEMSQTDDMLQLLLQSGAMGLSQKDIRKVLASVSGSTGSEDMSNRFAAIDATELHQKIQSTADIANLDEDTKEYLHGLGFTDETKFKNITVEALYEKMGGSGSWQQALVGGRSIRQQKKEREREEKRARFAAIHAAQRQNSGANQP